MYGQPLIEPLVGREECLQSIHQSLKIGTMSFLSAPLPYQQLLYNLNGHGEAVKQDARCFQVMLPLCIRLSSKRH